MRSALASDVFSALLDSWVALIGGESPNQPPLIWLASALNSGSVWDEGSSHDD